jgi:hypothetical protein
MLYVDVRFFDGRGTRLAVQHVQKQTVRAVENAGSRICLARARRSAIVEESNASRALGNLGRIGGSMLCRGRNLSWGDEQERSAGGSDCRAPVSCEVSMIRDDDEPVAVECGGVDSEHAAAKREYAPLEVVIQALRRLFNQRMRLCWQ